MDRIRELQAKRLETLNRAEVINQMAATDKRDLTSEESTEIDQLLNQVELLGKEIERQERIEANLLELGQSRGRLASANDPANSAAGISTPSVGDVRPGNLANLTIVQNDDKGKFGYKNFGEFASDVKAACAKQPFLSDKLQRIMNAPTTFSSEGVGGDGGYLVPPDFQKEIIEKVYGEDSFVPLTDNRTTPRNTMVWPVDEDTPWSTTGIQAFWEAEAAQLQQSKILLQNREIRLNKVTVLIPVTEELLEDTASLDTYLRRKSADKIDFKITNAIVNGSGVGMPLGILNSASTITVPKVTGQPAGTIVGDNIMQMWASIYAPWRRGAVWLVNQDIEPQLFAMYMAFQNSTGTTVGGWPLYLPSGGLSNKPFDTIMGKRVIYTQACQMVGSPGDIILVNLKQYLTAMKAGGPRVDVSAHLWFDYGMMAYRIMLRFAGQPWWNSQITPLNDATNLLSWAAVLAQRS